jgi:hypothetical protein
LFDICAGATWRHRSQLFDICATWRHRSQCALLFDICSTSRTTNGYRPHAPARDLSGNDDEKIDTSFSTREQSFTRQRPRLPIRPTRSIDFKFTHPPAARVGSVSCNLLWGPKRSEGSEGITLAVCTIEYYILCIPAAEVYWTTLRYPAAHTCARCLFPSSQASRGVGSQPLAPIFIS